MNKIVFDNGTEIECVYVEEGPIFYNNANRRMLTVQVDPKEIGLDDLDALLSNSDNLAKLKNVNEENGAEDSFIYYQIKIEMAKKPVPIGQDEDGTELTEERIVFKLGRYTPIEIKLVQLGLM